MLRVCVVFGGVSSEHEVSLRSAACILENIDRDKYEPVLLGITKDGRWLHYTGPEEMIPTGEWERTSFVRAAVISPDRRDHGLLLLEEELPASVELRRRLVWSEPKGKTAEKKGRQFLLTLAPWQKGRAGDQVVADRFARLDAKGNAISGPQVLPMDVAFPMLHGRNGEDGTIQGLLEMAGIPYVGSGVLASAACMDKEFTHQLLTQAGIQKTRLVAVRQEEMHALASVTDRLERELGYPMFVKPANAGSSVGVSKVKAREELSDALNLAFDHDVKAVVEAAVVGREIECAVLGNGNPIAANTLGEILPSRDFYDYDGKYLDDTAGLKVPTDVDPEIARELRETAVRAYRIMGCAGLSRVDFFVEADGTVVLNEINTIPGFTSISMYPRMFQADGMSISKLVDRLLELAMEKA